MAEEAGEAGNGRALAGVLAANVLFGAGLFAHAFLYNFYLQANGHGPAVMGDAAAALTAGGLTALIPAATLVDRWGPRAAYGVAASVGAAGLAWGALAVRPAEIYIAAFLGGAGTATWRVAMAPLLLRLTSGRLRTRALSWNVGLLVASGAVWTALSGGATSWLPDVLGVDAMAALRLTLLAGAAATFLAAPAVVLSRSPARRPTAIDEVTLARPRARLGGFVWAGVVLVGVWMAGSALVLPFFNVFFERVHALPIARVGVILALSQALTAVALAGSAEVAARLGPHRALIAWMLMFPPVLWLMGMADALPLVTVLFLIQGVVPAATNPLIDQVLLERVRSERHGAVSGARNAATELSGLLGATAGGRILEALSFGALFGVAGGVALSGAVGLSLWLRRLQSAGGDPSEMRPPSSRQTRSA